MHFGFHKKLGRIGLYIGK